METITVRAAANDGRVVLWEQRPGHPDLWIAGDGRAVDVPLTPAVQAAIARGVLVVVASEVGPAPTPEVGPVSNVETFARQPRKKR
jgi:hypothetical protein